MRKPDKYHIMQKLNIIFCLFSLTLFGQNKLMDYNKNIRDFEFVASDELKKEFKLIENSKDKIQIIAKIENDTIISIYLKNNTKDSINFGMQDSHLYLIQEAKNEKGEWKPIEYWSYSWCGNSYFSDKVEGQKIIKTETEKYNGTFETEIRFKFLINNEELYSNSLKCNIDLTQFVISENFTQHSTYKGILRASNKELAEKVLFLEPNAMKESYKKQKKWLKKITKKNKKRIENKQTE